MRSLKECDSLALATDWVSFIGPPSIGCCLLYGKHNENWEEVWKDTRNIYAMKGWSYDHNLDTTGFFPLANNCFWLMQPNPIWESEPGTDPKKKVLTGLKVPQELPAK